MDIELKNKWLAALRSGQYTQTTGMLKSCENGFCCLGVLADIMEDTEWSDFRYPGQKSTSCAFVHNGDVLDSDEDIPWAVACKLSLTKKVMVTEQELIDDMDPFETDLVSHLMSLNDTAKWDFNKIADYIEENL